MTNKLYDIYLDGEKIGHTALEKADAPMGVVFGEIIFSETVSGYDFFRKYCLIHNIDFTDYPEDRLITTTHIPGLKVSDSEGKRIKGESCHVFGSDGDIFEIEITFIPYPFYEEEFPHHVKSYNDMFGDSR